MSYFISPLESAWADWIKNTEVTHFITLTFRHEIRCGFRADKSLREFHKKLTECVHGNRSDRKLTFFAVREMHGSEGWHFHILVNAHKVKSEKFRLMVRECWMAAGGHCGDPFTQDPSNRKWFQRISRKEIQMKKCQYSCKNLSNLRAEVILDTLHPDWASIKPSAHSTRSASEMFDLVEWVETERAKMNKSTSSKPTKAKSVQSILTEQQILAQHNFLGSALAF